MPNYSFIVGSRFKPLTYDEIVKPLQQQTELQNQYEDAYAQLSTQAETLRQRAMQEPNAEWSKRYLQYAESLEKSASDLASRGLNQNSRAMVNQARTGFARDIVPIQTAIARQTEIAKLQQAQNPALRMVYGNMPTIDQLIADPTKTSQGYSGADIEKSAMTSAAAESARRSIESFAQDPNNVGWMRYIKETGYSTEAFQALLKAAQDPNNTEANVIRDIIDNVKSQFGYSEDANLSKAQKDKLDSEILSGLFKGVGYKNESQYQQDPIYMENLRFKHVMEQQHDAQRHQEKMAREDAKRATQQQQPAGLAINPMNLYNTQEVDNATKEANLYKSYFYTDKDGKLKMNQKGWAEYNRKVAHRTGDTRTTPEGTTILVNVKTSYSDSPFKQYMDKLNKGRAVTTQSAYGPWARERFGSLYSSNIQTLKSHGKTYDAHKETEYDYKLSGSQQDDWKSAVLTAYSGVDDIPTMQYGKDGFTPKGTISASKLASSDYKIVSTRFSTLGNTAIVQDKNGSTFRIELPDGINPRNEANRQSALNRAEAYRQAITSGQLSQEDMVAYSQRYSQALQEAYLFHSQLGVQNKTKEQEFNPYGY